MVARLKKGTKEVRGTWPRPIPPDGSKDQGGDLGWFARLLIVEPFSWPWSASTRTH